MCGPVRISNVRQGNEQMVEGSCSPPGRSKHVSSSPRVHNHLAELPPFECIGECKVLGNLTFDYAEGVGAEPDQAPSYDELMLH